MSGHSARWLCCQLGAREHYAVPRAIDRLGRLQALVTDAWVRPRSAASMMPGESGRRLRERYHADLSSARVIDFTGSLLMQELRWRARGATGWPLVMARNRWFQHAAATVVTRDGRPGQIVFAHSYSALAVFKAAKARDCVTVLGQIDPGPEHARISREIAAQHPEYGFAPEQAPEEYYDRWREESSLADRIIVNSEWSRSAIERAGVEPRKIRVVPLPYESESRVMPRSFPDAFSRERPLRVLFVGTASTTKGVPALLDAMRRVDDLPIHLELVGDSAMQVPGAYRQDARITWTGAVPRSVVMDRYRASDVLVFPSHSDGFGMAQVEARAWGLPIVASRHCGAVAVDGETGWLLHEVSGDAIARVFREIVAAPNRLRQFASAMLAAPAFTIDAFGRALMDAVS